MTRRKRRATFLSMCCLTLSGAIVGGGLRAEEACSGIFKAAEVARRDFATKIGGYPPENDFQRHAQNIENYDVGLSETQVEYVIALQLRNGNFGVVKGGGARYWIRKSDFSVSKFRGEE